MQRKLIEVINEENNTDFDLEEPQDTANENYNNQIPIEEKKEQKEPIKLSKNGKIAQKEARKEAERSRNTDLLRLEKNYFEGVYHSDKFKDEKDFVVQNLINKKETVNRKPDIGGFEKSECLIFIVT